MKAILEINANQLLENTKRITSFCHDRGITVMGVTKGLSGLPAIAEIMVKGGVDFIADARIENLKKQTSIRSAKVLLRVPAPSEVADVVRYADISLNSEIKTLTLISQEAKKQNKNHKVILMVDLGEWREGILIEDFDTVVQMMIQLPHITLYGIGVTFTCINGVIPDENHMAALSKLALATQEKYGRELQIISAGNSSSYFLAEKNQLLRPINNIRFGEALLLGRETAFGLPIAGLDQQVFTLKVEIVELKTKPTLPIGCIGMDAFGRVPNTVDRGLMVRALLAIGAQDVDYTQLTPVDSRIELIGSSSDYIVVNLTACPQAYNVGDTIAFQVNYSALMRLSTSEYVIKQVL